MVENGTAVEYGQPLFGVEASEWDPCYDSYLINGQIITSCTFLLSFLSHSI